MYSNEMSSLPKMEISVIFPLILLIFGNFRISVQYQYISVIFTDILEPEISVEYQ